MFTEFAPGGTVTVVFTEWEDGGGGIEVLDEPETGGTTGLGVGPLAPPDPLFEVIVIWLFEPSLFCPAPDV